MIFTQLSAFPFATACALFLQDSAGISSISWGALARCEPRAEGVTVRSTTKVTGVDEGGLLRVIHLPGLASLQIHKGSNVKDKKTGMTVVKYFSQSLVSRNNS